MHRRRLALTLGLGVALGTALIFLRLSPRVVEVAPAPGSGAVPADSPVRLAFSRPMQPASVAERLTIEPSPAGSVAWAGNTLTFTPDRPWPAGVTVTVHLAAGARSTVWLPLLEGRTWSFRVARPLLAYLWPADGPADLYALDPFSGEIERLTTTPHGALDYSVSPDGRAIYFSAANAAGGSDLYRLEWPAGAITPLLECSRDFCRNPRAAPQGDYLAYQRLAADGERRVQVWLHPLEGSRLGEATLIAEVSREPAVLSWSPTGLLSLYDPDEQAFLFQDPRTSELERFPNLTGEAGAWSPDGALFVAPEILFPNPGQPDTGEVVNPSHLLTFSRLDGSVEDLTLLGNVEDTLPAFSPDGEWLAFARKYLDVRRWTPGRQLWIRPANGGQAHPLTDDPLYSHSHFTWSPDGRWLAYMRFNQSTLTDPPEIWMIGVDGRNPMQLLIRGYDPQWIP